MNGKLLQKAALAGLAVALLTPTLEARPHYRMVASPCPPAVVAPATSSAPAAVSVTRTYEAFSYEPAPAPAVVAPAVPMFRAAPAPDVMKWNAANYGKMRSF